MVLKPQETNNQPPLPQVIQKPKEVKNEPLLAQVIQKPEEAKNQPPPTQVAQKPEEEKNQPHLTRTDVEFKVFVMKVAELKKELKSRGKDTTGLKKDLRTRLISVILEQAEKDQAQTLSASNKSTIIPVTETMEASEVEKNEIAISMEVSTIKEVEEEMSPAPPQDSDDQRKDQKKESISSVKVEHHNETSELIKETKHRPEEANENSLVSSEKRHEECQNLSKSVPRESLNKTRGSLAPINEMVVTSSSEPSKRPPNSEEEKPALLTETKMKEFSESQNESDAKENVPAPVSEVSVSSKASGTSVKDMVSKFSGFSTNLSSNSGSALSKGLQAKKEARQAKIAEMRAKVRSDFFPFCAFVSML